MQLSLRMGAPLCVVILLLSGCYQSARAASAAIPEQFHGVWATDPNDCAGLLEDGPTIIVIDPDGLRLKGPLIKFMLSEPNRFIGTFHQSTKGAEQQTSREEFLLSKADTDDKIDHITTTDRMTRISAGKAMTYQRCDWGR